MIYCTKCFHKNILALYIPFFFYNLIKVRNFIDCILVIKFIVYPFQNDEELKDQVDNSVKSLSCVSLQLSFEKK